MILKSFFPKSFPNHYLIIDTINYPSFNYPFNHRKQRL